MQLKEEKTSIIGRFFQKISGNLDEYSFEHRLFNATLFLTFLIGLFSTIINVFIHLYNSAFSTLSISLIMIYLYKKSKSKQYIKPLVYAYILITSVWIVYLWIYNAGSYGPVGFTFFLIVFVYNVIYTGNKRFILNVWIIFLMLSLFVIEYTFPNLIENYKDFGKERFFDMIFSAFIEIIIYAYIVAFLIKTFKEERKKVINQRDLIIEKNEEIKQTQSELFEHKENLEKIVKQRTLALEKEKEKAERSDKLKTAFLSNMSHEIRTPMNVILGLTQIMKEKNMSEQQRKYYLDIITQKGNLLLNIINDIIDIAKIESNELKINKEASSLNDILEDVHLTYINILAKENKDVKVILNIAPELQNKTIITDPLRLKQVLFNLVENAKKFTKKGHIKISAEIKNNRLLISVEDTGIGIPKDKFDIIFNRFRQVEDINTKSHEGTGLGLTISKKIIELLQGKIYLTSELNKGTTFYVELPLQVVENQQQNKKTTEENNIAVNWTNKKILIAEDEEFNFLILKDILEDTGIEIVHAKNGVETIQLIDNSFDVMMLDIQMPQKSGYEICPEIKEKYPDLPVIAQTAYVMNEEKQELLRLGCDDIITKPIDFDLLIATLKKYLTH